MIWTRIIIQWIFLYFDLNHSFFFFHLYFILLQFSILIMNEYVKCYKSNHNLAQLILLKSFFLNKNL
jgi:hypothetical protein